MGRPDTPTDRASVEAPAIAALNAFEEALEAARKMVHNSNYWCEEKPYDQDEAPTYEERIQDTLTTLRQEIQDLLSERDSLQQRLNESLMRERSTADALLKVSAERDAAVKRTEELEKLVYVPGAWRCAKCGCVVSSMVFCAADGGVVIKADDHGKPCPNGCGPLWRQTERDAGNEMAESL